MNVLAQRVLNAFADSPSVTHVFDIRIELSELDARNHGDESDGSSIEEIVEDKLREIQGVRSLSVESQIYEREEAE